MAPIHIPRAEHGTIRVFAISRPMASMARTLKQQSKVSLASSLLGQSVNPEDFELFAVSDLTGVGLPGYLAEGYDIDQQAIRQDRARLDALDGYVLLVFSRISDAQDITLAPHSDLTLIGTYTEPRAEHATAPIEVAAAKPFSGLAPTPKAPRRSRAGSALTAAVGILILLFLIWWIFL